MSSMLTGYWRVTAGVLVGREETRYSRQFHYTSDLYEQDREVTDPQATHFAAKMKQAHEYAMSITNPTQLNWVRVEWIWL